MFLPSTKNVRMSLKLSFTLVAAIGLLLLSVAESHAQGRGLRIGNSIQMGGGQGFRMGGPRFGMHFGGGQGASFGGQNFGMRFGNGQGARFGTSEYGMQFGGGHGTQIGRIAPAPMAEPGTYYYGDSQPYYYPAPIVPQPVPSSQPEIVDDTAPTIIAPTPGIASPEIQPEPHNDEPLIESDQADPDTELHHALEHVDE